MDKYEFNIKIEQIKKLVGKSDYETAMKIADTIDWRRVRNINLLSTAAMIYEKNEEYQLAKEILLQAFERAPISKRLLYKLAEMAVKEGSIEEAEAYYREFGDLASDDPRQQLLRYMILKAKGAPVQQLIHSLEAYTSVELDERWLYELAELYSLADMPDRCVETCDRIMLMFGLGKYVDKAMELKVRYAPLTSYQMDLAENRDKYEAKLRAVEQEFESGNGGAKISEPEMYEEEVPAEELQYSEEPDWKAAEETFYGEEPGEDEFPHSRPDPAYDGGSKQEELAGGQDSDVYRGSDMDQDFDIHQDLDIDQNIDMNQDSGMDQNIDMDQDFDIDQDIDMNRDSGMDQSLNLNMNRTPDPAQSMFSADDNLTATMQEAAAQEKLAREISKISGDETSLPREESQTERTRVLEDIRRVSRPAALVPEAKEEVPAVLSAPVISPAPVIEEDSEKEQEDIPVRNHLMIEAGDPEQGLKLAVETLKQIHKESGIKNPVAKITGSKLSRLGVLASVNQLAGKDLVVEAAGDLTSQALGELNDLMEQDTSGMIIVLIDNSGEMEMLHRENPILAGKFECIGSGESSPVSEDETAAAETGAGSAAYETAAFETGTAEYESAASINAIPYPDYGESRRFREYHAEENGSPEGCQSSQSPSADYQPDYHPSEDYQTDYYPTDDNYDNDFYEENEEIRPSVRDEEGPGFHGEEMDIDEFAQYACRYANEIDCSITGKSMLALYERIEIMEEDGIPLNRDNAENLIEEAADRAEKPSFGKRLKNIFSTKYDKDGLLILKEEHFIC